MKTKFLLLTLVLAQSVFASNISTTQKATASLNSTCRLEAGNAVFGTYDPNAATEQQTTQNINILCSRGTAWTIYTGANDVYSNNAYAAMTSGSNKLLYQAQLTNGNWENDTYHNSSMVGTPRGTGTGDIQSVSITYRILPNQYVAPGNYIDTPTAFLLF